MPRNGAGVFDLAAGSLVTDNVDDILASQHNTPLLDLKNDANIPRPIVAGGTGASSASGARTALGLGTVAELDTGTASGEVRTNAQNEALFAPFSAASALSGQFKVMNGDFSISASGESGDANVGVDSVYPFSGRIETKLTAPGIASVMGKYPQKFYPFRLITGGGSASWAWTLNNAAIGHLVPTRFFSLTSTGQIAAGDFVVLIQRIESARTYGGQTVTFFNWMKRATAGNVAFSIRQHFGTGGSPSADVTTYIGQNTLTTSWAPYRLVAAVPSVAGKTFGANNDDYLEIVYWISAGSTYNATTGSLGLQNTTVDFYGVYDRVGDMSIDAINYYQPSDPQAETAGCQL